MGKKRALRHRRDGGHDVPGVVDTLIGRFMKMVKRGEMKPNVANLIRLIEMREKLAPRRVTVRWIEGGGPRASARRRPMKVISPADDELELE